MTNLHKALAAFWGGFGLPAYQRGYVPVNAPLPYITFDAASGAYFRSAILTAYVWVKRLSGVSPAAQLAGTLDRIAAAIPEQGARLSYEGGMALVTRNVDFMGYYDDPEDDSVSGARVSYEIRYYDL